jgi:hypothetical protein
MIDKPIAFRFVRARECSRSLIPTDLYCAASLIPTCVREASSIAASAPGLPLDPTYSFKVTNRSCGLFFLRPCRTSRTARTFVPPAFGIHVLCLSNMRRIVAVFRSSSAHHKIACIMARMTLRRNVDQKCRSERNWRSSTRGGCWV